MRGSLAARRRPRPGVAYENQFRADVLAGLSAHPKTLPCKYFYDAEGSRLFERICALPEYYLTRTECRILEQHAPAIAAALGPRARLVEFGAGPATKAQILLSALNRPAAYAPVDISAPALAKGAGEIALRFPGLRVLSICADYTRPFELPAAIARGPGALCGFFPGSTIGNFAPGEATDFLSRARQLLGRDAFMIVGVDLRKDVALLQAAYDDAAGITAAFNRNVLRRINTELGGDFSLSAFAHEARWNDTTSCVEMHLVARGPMTVHVTGVAFEIMAGESIHTENSYKFTFGQFQRLAREAGWRPQAAWRDDLGWFSVHLLRA